MKITVLAEKRNAAVFTLSPAVDHVYLYDNLQELLKIMGAKFDLVIDSEQSHYLSAVVARLIKAPLKIGFATNERRRMFTHTVSYSHDDYEMYCFYRLLEPLMAAPISFDYLQPFLNVPAESLATVDQMLHPLAGREIVAIFPGASIAERRWLVDNFAVIAQLLEAAGYAVVVIGGPVDAGAGEVICQNGGVNLTGKTTLIETAALLARSKLLISGDSGVLHLAVGLDVPTVSLFGPGIAKKWAPRGEKHIVINHELPCSPCTQFGNTPRCKLGARCMTEISVEEVTGAIFLLLHKK